MVRPGLEKIRSSETCTFSVVVTCFHSASWLSALIERLVCTMDELGEAYEVILIDDGSGDSTWGIIEKLASLDPRVRGFNLLTNVGQHRATICGFDQAGGRYIVTMDDDLQHRPEDIPLLVERLREEPDVDCVIASFSHKEHSWWRKAGSRAMGLLTTRLYDRPLELQMTAFRAMKREIALGIVSHQTAKPMIGPLLLQTTRRIVNVAAEHQPRKYSRSGYSLPRLVSMVRDNMIGASTLPLNALSIFGLVSALVSLALGLYYATRYWLGSIGVPGFTTQVLLISFFGGMTLLSIGILGQYVVRILQEVAPGPRYQIRRVANATERPIPGSTS